MKKILIALLSLASVTACHQPTEVESTANTLPSRFTCKVALNSEIGNFLFTTTAFSTDGNNVDTNRMFAWLYLNGNQVALATPAPLLQESRGYWQQYKFVKNGYTVYFTVDNYNSRVYLSATVLKDGKRFIMTPPSDRSNNCWAR